MYNSLPPHTPVGLRRRETIPDPEGVQVDSINPALTEALRALDEIRSEDPAATRG